MAYYCNPVNLEYQYQFFRKKDSEICRIHREAADPSLICVKDMFYLFPSMSAGFYISRDMVHWEHRKYLGDIPWYDYAPDIRYINGCFYLCASSDKKNGDFYKTPDPLTQPFERISGSFPFWDPNLFMDDDGRLYIYWGSSNFEPIYGRELDPLTMQPEGEKIGLIYPNEGVLGYEKDGENHILPRSDAEVREKVEAILAQYTDPDYVPDEENLTMLKRMFGNGTYLEGPWMTKHNGKYYLQYAATGTEYNVYCDGVYVSDHPLGPFTPAKNNPFSYKPGGFITGAGHGSTFRDPEGRIWHISSMRISVNHSFERRVGIWKTEFDDEGELCCNQRYGDWPVNTDSGMWDQPDWMLLSYGKKVLVSSGADPQAAADENIRTCWQAEQDDKDAWIMVDLGQAYSVHSVQVNFGDSWTMKDSGEKAYTQTWDDFRRIEDQPEKNHTRWLLEGSEDGEVFEVICDKRNAETDLSHDYIVLDRLKRYRFIRLSGISLPYGQKPCVSGIRVFGRGSGKRPEGVSDFVSEMYDDVSQDKSPYAVPWKKTPDDVRVLRLAWKKTDACGYNILWGYSPEKLYHSCMVYGNQREIRGLCGNQELFVRIDAYNENGITEGTTKQISVDNGRS
ncbi:MAG: family 43 glycosylhydrolase [Bilifractor sp.]